MSENSPIGVRTVQRIVASCFYAELVVERALDQSGADSFAAWTAMYAAPSTLGYEEPEFIRAREDLARCGRETFRQDWEFLLQLVATVGRDNVRRLLDGVLAESVADGYARRAARTGVA